MKLDVVLTGGTGFVGSAVLRSAAGRRVHVLVRDKNRLPAIDARIAVRVVDGDIRYTPKDLFPATPHVVIHLATKQIDSDGTGFEEINVEGTRSLLARCNDSTRGILYGSSVSVYGQDPHIDVDESALIHPETALAETRARAERSILRVAASRGIPAYCLRPRFIFGHGDRHTLPGLTRLVKSGFLLGSGKQRYSIIDVDDYARVLLALIAGIERGGTTEQMGLNLAYRRSVSLNDIVSVICRQFQLKPPKVRLPAKRFLARLLKALPGRQANSAAMRLELYGFTHTFRVDALAERVGSSIPEADPMAVLRAAAAGRREPPNHAAAEAQTRCSS